MSKYTTEIRYICEYYAGLTASVGNDKVVQVIENSRDKIFDFDYPIFDTSYKSVLETKILSHFYTREICEETVGLWKHRLYAKMNEIMPYYNKLYKSEAIKIDPITNILKVVEGNKNKEGTETDTRNINGTVKEINNDHATSSDTEINATRNSAQELTTRNGTETVNKNDSTEYVNLKEATEHLDKYSELPQGDIQNVLDGRWLTNAREVADDKTTTGKINETAVNDTTATDSRDLTNTESTFTNNTTNTSENTNDRIMNRENLTVDVNSNALKTTDEYVEKISGYEGISSSELLKQYRDNILNIDMMIINELNDLFIQLW